MDLVYVPDVLSFGSFRSPQYRDYEQPWNRNYFDEGKGASTYQHHRQQPQHHQQQQHHRESAAGRDSCYLCKENKRRSLAAYIRGKTRKSSCDEICEEEEEDEREEQPQRRQVGKQAGDRGVVSGKPNCPGANSDKSK